MKIKTALLVAFSASLLAVTASAQSTEKAGHPAPVNEDKIQHRVVMQMRSADSLEHKSLLNNLKNLKEAWGDSVIIEVVVFGPGISLVTKNVSTQQQPIQKMIEQGVQFVACRNTMKQRKITEAQIIPNVGFVESAIQEIIRKQESGWSYIKSGF